MFDDEDFDPFDPVNDPSVSAQDMFNRDPNWRRTGPRTWERIEWIPCSYCKGTGKETKTEVRFLLFKKTREVRCGTCDGRTQVEKK